MALPITPTPILKGDDSRRFNEELQKSSSKKISQSERLKGLQLVEAVLKNANI
jgi:hypothetical protein